MKQIKIKNDYVTLGQLLKIIGIIQSGGEAKIYLSENVCYVNNEQENRRGRKLYPNDLIEIEKEIYKIE